MRQYPEITAEMRTNLERCSYVAVLGIRKMMLCCKVPVNWVPLGESGKVGCHPHRNSHTSTPRTVKAVVHDQEFWAAARSWSSSSASRVLLVAASANSAMRDATRSSNN